MNQKTDNLTETLLSSSTTETSGIGIFQYKNLFLLRFCREYLLTRCQDQAKLYKILQNALLQEKLNLINHTEHSTSRIFEFNKS